MLSYYFLLFILNYRRLLCAWCRNVPGFTPVDISDVSASKLRGFKGAAHFWQSIPQPRASQTKPSIDSGFS